MTDKELLDLAAKAAGINRKWSPTNEASEAIHENIAPLGNYMIWNPLTDDGDALRLAVKLRLEIDIHHTGISVRTPTGIKVLVSAEDESNANVATRRAIVRAAAEIGKNA